MDSFECSPTLDELTTKYFENGETSLFLESSNKQNIDLWGCDTLFYAIQETCVDQTNKRCSAHYDLMKVLIDASFEEYDIWQDDDYLKKWIHLLVEHKYPWFVCSSWNHLRPVAISFLHHTSLVYQHFGVLHQLLRHDYIDHMWNDEFLYSIVDQSEFYRMLMKPKYKSFLKIFKKQLDHYPFYDEESIAITLESIYLCNANKVLRLFLNHPQSISFWDKRELLHKVCVMCDTELFDAVYSEHHEDSAPEIEHWWKCFSVIFGDIHLCSKTKEEKKNCFKMFSHLLDKFEQHMQIQDWCPLLLHSEMFFFKFFVRSPKCLELLQRVWTYLIHSIESSSPTDTITIMSRYCNYEYTISYRELLDLHHNKLLFYKLNDSCNKNCRKWSFFANVLRWCNYPTTKWIMQQCNDEQILYDTLCVSSSAEERFDNPITLALYNIDSRILDRIINTLQEKEREDLLCEWILMGDGTSVITSLVRLSLFYPRQAPIRFLRMLKLCSTLHIHKSKLVETLIQEWHYHRNINTDFSRSHNQFESFASNELLNQLLELPFALESKSLCGLLSQCENENVFKKTINVAFSKYQLIHPIDAYIELIKDRSVPIRHILAFEQHPEMQTQLKSFPKQQSQIILHWLIRDENPEFDFFMNRAKHQWLWNMHKMFSTNITDLYVNATNYEIQYLKYYEWYTIVCNGLLPLCVFYTSHNTQFDFLYTMLKAFRLVRRCLQRRFKLLRRSISRSRKRLHFMIKCQPDCLTKNKIQNVGIYYSKHFN